MEQVQTGAVEMCGYNKGAGGGCWLILVGICLLPFWGIGLIFIILALFAGGSRKTLYRCSLCKNPVAYADVRVCPSCQAPLKPKLSWMERMEETTRERKAELARMRELQDTAAVPAATEIEDGVPGLPPEAPVNAAPSLIKQTVVPVKAHWAVFIVKSFLVLCAVLLGGIVILACIMVALGI